MSKNQNPAGIMNEAVAQHRAGNLDAALVLYEKALGIDESNFDALHLLGVLHNQRGDPEKAIELISGAIEGNSNVAAYHSNLGVALRGAGKPDDARAAFDRAISIDAGLLDAYLNKAALLTSASALEEALECLLTASRVAPDSAPVQVNLAQVHTALGNSTRARELCEQVIAQTPDYVPAHRALADIFLEVDDFSNAQKHFHRIFELQQCGAWTNSGNLDSALKTLPAGATGPSGTTAFELQNTREHVEYLIEKGALDASFDRISNTCEEILNSLDAESEPGALRTLSESESAALTGLFRKALHYRDQPRLEGPSVNAENNFSRIEDTYLRSPTAAIEIDNFLAPDALEGLRRFCLDCTIFSRPFGGAFVPAYMDQGFNCSLLYQIVQELKTCFPRVLGRQKFNGMWVYRYPSRSAGVRAHTDEGSVTFNFWLTPDEANLDPGGGLRVYTKEQPMDWNWHLVNSAKDRPEFAKEIEEFLGDAPTMDFAYRENRAVMFHSNLFHQSQPFRFAPGYEQRRMNVTMLFGARGTDARRPRPNMLGRLRKWLVDA